MAAKRTLERRPLNSRVSRRKCQMLGRNARSSTGACTMIPASMHLAPGAKLGPYDIVSPLGSGGTKKWRAACWQLIAPRIAQPELGSLDSFRPSGGRLLNCTHVRCCRRHLGEMPLPTLDRQSRTSHRAGISVPAGARRKRRWRTEPRGILAGVLKNIPRVLLSIGRFPLGRLVMRA